MSNTAVGDRITMQSRIESGPEFVWNVLDSDIHFSRIKFVIEKP